MRTIMPIYDALYDYTDRLKHIVVRHEQGGITRAQVMQELRLYRRRLCDKWPGSTNLVTGLADAMIDSHPIVCVTGQVFASLW